MLAVYMTDSSHLNRRWAETPDEDLVREAVAGDEDAFRALCERYGPVLSAYLAGRTPARADAEDLLQDVYIKAYRALPRLHRRGAFGPWLLKIARRELAEFHRSRRRLESLDAVSPPVARAEPIEAREVATLVLSALGELKDGYREVVYLRVVEQWSNGEIAAKLGMREGNVRMRSARGLAMLKEKLQRKGIDW